jgi:hypothetical protein
MSGGLSEISAATRQLLHVFWNLERNLILTAVFPSEGGETRKDEARQPSKESSAGREGPGELA